MIILATVGVAAFHSLKGNIRDTENRLTQQIEAVSLDLRPAETRLREDMKDLRADLTELKADNRVLNDKLDRGLKILVMAKS